MIFINNNIFCNITYKINKKITYYIHSMIVCLIILINKDIKGGPIMGNLKYEQL